MDCEFFREIDTFIMRLQCTNNTIQNLMLAYGVY